VNATLAITRKDAPHFIILFQGVDHKIF